MQTVKSGAILITGAASGIGLSLPHLTNQSFNQTTNKVIKQVMRVLNCLYRVVLWCLRECVWQFRADKQSTGKDEREMETLQAEVEGSAGKLKPVRMDVSDSASVAAAFDFVSRFLSSSRLPLVSVICSAGLFVEGPLELVRSFIH